MSALDEIRGREQKASNEIARLTTGNPGTNWRWSIPANPERDSDLILADSIADVARLLNATQAALDLHKVSSRGYCPTCDTFALGPCPTVRAITSALEAKS